ncbi:MAG: PAS domain-containing protein [Deltaproteobacteria bacterium]|nr:PAS domain-containing protein [Deltaproteobacteria bacterium]
MDSTHIAADENKCASEIKELAHRLQFNPGFLEMFVNYIMDSHVFWIVEVKPEPELLYISPAFETVWGQKKNVICSDMFTWLDSIHEDDRGRIEKVLAGFFQGQCPYDVNYRIRRPDGTLRWIWSRGGLLNVALKKNVYAVGVTQDMTCMKLMEQDLQQQKSQVREQNGKLDDIGTALRVLMSQRDKEKHELEEKVLYNVKELVQPAIGMLKKSNLDPRQRSYLAMLEMNLQGVTASFSHRLSSKLFNLTSTEIKIADYVKNGRTTKEIAELVYVSSKTVENHRKNIRRKLGMSTKKENLRTRLLSLQ